jgi:hypothetical protein
MIAIASLLLAALSAQQSDPHAPPEPSAAGKAPEPPDFTRPPGVAPVDLIPRLELRQWYGRTTDGTRIHQTTAQIDIKFFNRVLVRYEGHVQVVTSPTGEQSSGFGDTEVHAYGSLGSGPRYVAIVILGGVFDTANQPVLGQGKPQVHLGGGLGVKPALWAFPYLIVQQQVSIGGDPSRPDINELLVRFGSVFFAKDHTWYIANFDAFADFEQRAGRLYGAFEFGSLLVGRVGLFMRGATQLLGTRRIDYSVETGIRYLFRLGKD